MGLKNYFACIDLVFRPCFFSLLLTLRTDVKSWLYSFMSKGVILILTKTFYEWVVILCKDYLVTDFITTINPVSEPQ